MGIDPMNNISIIIRILFAVTLFQQCTLHSSINSSIELFSLSLCPSDLVVYVHTNLCVIYRQREEWLKGKTKMWDEFLDDMGLDSSVELALANLDPNEPVLEPVTFDDGDPLEGSSSTSRDAQIALDIEEEEEDGRESSGSGSDVDLDDYDMENY
jgi:hypothetical protein